MLIGEWSSQDDEPGGHEAVHERRVFGPTGLLLERASLSPLRAAAPLDDEERHPLTSAAISRRRVVVFQFRVVVRIPSTLSKSGRREPMTPLRRRR